ncbi:MAG: SGNH/GDSL hydrolase family protein [Nevskia sp.]|nr:SGNH/GDSL hydrolase family protein [Nevskia sp.]
MPKSIDLKELENLLEDADVTADVAKRYFDCGHGPDGKLQVTLRPGVVVTASGGDSGQRYWNYVFDDLDGGIAGWLIRTEMKNRLKKYRSKIAANPQALRIVAEGDSWFEHPLNRDLLDYLGRELDLAVFSLASGGTTLEQMLKPKDYLQAVIDEKPSVFLLSAGGNDFLGNIKPYLVPWTPKPGPTSSEYDPRDFVSAQFATLLVTLKGWLDTVVGDVLGQRSVKRVVLHGYDYVLPNAADDDRSGGWVGKPMRELKITAEYLQAGIVRLMIDRYCELLQAVAADPRWKGKLRFVDFRGSLTRDYHWFDEIHPDAKQNRKLAAKMALTIRAA